MLGSSLDKVLSLTLLFDKQGSLPKKVDETSFARVCMFNRLFECRHPPNWDAEYIKEISIKELRLAFFVAFACPFTGKLGGT